MALSDVTAINVIQGTGSLYWAPLGTALPDAAAALPVAWTKVGSTEGGITVTRVQSYTEIRVDQAAGRVGSRLTEEEVTIETELAEATLENLRLSMNLGAVTTAATVRTLALTNGDPNAVPTYFALALRGPGPQLSSGTSLLRQIYVAKALVTDDIELGYNKEDKTTISVTFTSHFVADGTNPVTITETTV